MVGSGDDAGDHWETWKVTRLDIDPDTKPDIVASMTGDALQHAGDGGRYDNHLADTRLTLCLDADG